MEGVPYFIPVEDAQSITLNTLPSARAEECELDHAHGRILSQDLVSKVNDPPFDIHRWMDLHAVFTRQRRIPSH